MREPPRGHMLDTTDPLSLRYLCLCVQLHDKCPLPWKVGSLPGLCFPCVFRSWYKEPLASLFPHNEATVAGGK
jgi:hypothetical protein